MLARATFRHVPPGATLLVPLHLLILACSPSEAAPDPALRIFYLGNSFTGMAGGQPNLVAEFLAARGVESVSAAVTAGGETLRGHLATNRGEVPTWRERRITERGRQATKAVADVTAALRAKRAEWAARAGTLDHAFVDAGPWDVVVVQPGRGIVEPELFGVLPAARALTKYFRTHSKDATIVLYAAWADPRDGASQPEVDVTARRIARENDLVLAPVGTAMHAAFAERPDLDIFVSLGDPHPGRDGGYLIACVLYASITGKSPIGLPANLETRYAVEHPDKRQNRLVGYRLPEADAKFLQDVAWNTISAMEPL